MVDSLKSFTNGSANLNLKTGISEKHATDIRQFGSNCISSWKNFVFILSI